MMRRAGGFTQAEKVDRLYENLRAKYKLYVRLTDATDLAELAAKFEKITKAQESESRAEKHKVTIVAATAAKTALYDRNTACWQCKQRDHSRFDCKRLACKFCSQYGKDGVLTKDYHSRAENVQPAKDTSASRPRSA